MVYDLVAIVELGATLRRNEFRHFNASAFEELLKLALLRLKLPIVGEIGVDHSGHNALRGTFAAVGRFFNDLDKFCLYVVALLLDDLRLDLLASPCTWNEDNASVTKSPESVAAIDVLRNIDR